MENQGEIILYQPDKEVKLEVRLENETDVYHIGALAIPSTTITYLL